MSLLSLFYSPFRNRTLAPPSKQARQGLTRLSLKRHLRRQHPSCSSDSSSSYSDSSRYVSKTVEESSEKKTEVEEKPDINDVPTEDIQAK